MMGMMTLEVSVATGTREAHSLSISGTHLDINSVNNNISVRIIKVKTSMDSGVTRNSDRTRMVISKLTEKATVSSSTTVERRLTEMQKATSTLSTRQGT